MGQSQLPRDIAWASPRFLFHGYSYDALVGLCPQSTLAAELSVVPIYTFFLTETLLQSSKHNSVWMTSTRITPCISGNSTIIGTEGEGHVAVFVVCVCVCSMAIPSQLSPYVDSFFNTPSNQLLSSWKTALLRGTLINLVVACISKSEHFRTYVSWQFRLILF